MLECPCISEKLSTEILKSNSDTVGAFESLDNVMFMMRSQYGMQTDAIMWETIIVEASKLDSVIGNKDH